MRGHIVSQSGISATEVSAATKANPEPYRLLLQGIKALACAALMPTSDTTDFPVGYTILARKTRGEPKHLVAKILPSSREA
jgi:hypothetical protein